MGGAQWLLEIVLVLLLAATLFHALRLERALGVLKRDRSVLEELVEGFNESTRQAESGIDRLRLAADGAGRQMARQIEQSQRLRDDLTFLAERGERLAARLEGAVRSARMVGDMQDGAITLQLPQLQPSLPQPLAHPLHAALSRPYPEAFSPQAGAAALPPPVREASRLPAREPPEPFVPRGVDGPAYEVAEDRPRLRSQAERDLLRALRASR